MKLSTRSTALAAAMLASTLLVACDNNRTAGQDVDAAVNKTEQAGQEMRQEAREAGQEIRQEARQAGQEIQAAGEKAADAITSNTADAAITAKVNAALAGDTQLSALAINVDTHNGAVELKGTAPTEAARDRATTLAKAVDGVTKVTNSLTVDGKG